MLASTPWFFQKTGGLVIGGIQPRIAPLGEAVEQFYPLV